MNDRNDTKDATAHLRARQGNQDAPVRETPLVDQRPAQAAPQANQNASTPKPVDADPRGAIASMSSQMGPPPAIGRTADDPIEFNEEAVEALLDIHFAGIIVYDIQGTSLWASGKICEITGYTFEERIGHPGWELVYPDDLEEGARNWMYVVTEPGREVSFEQRLVRKDGRVIWVEARLKNLIGIKPMDAIVATYHEITERKAANAALYESERKQRDLANRDHLTGLSNRRAMTAELERAVHRLRAGEIDDFAFLFIDLDGFKKVNDRLGHAFGDEYLKTTARRVQEAMVDGDIVARIGGDEFAVLALSANSEAKSQALAHRLVHAMSDPVRIRGHLVQLPACVGVVNANARSWNPMEYMRYADAALYAAKQDGTGRVRVFDATLERHIHEQTSIAGELSHAVDRQELGVLYQPIVDMDTRKVVGMEALLCWHHPTRGLLRAGSFISVAEETGLIIPIGEYVFDQVCKDAARWQTVYGEHAPWVSCNLSAAQLIRQDFPAFVRNTVDAYGVPAGVVHFELTERGLFETEGPWRDRLWEAQAAGCPLMLDDFGTGYTSMRYLSEFPISTLKLDREYIAKSTDPDPRRRERALALIRAVSQMGESLNMRVVAEGVETEEQHRASVAAGCHLGQGWLYRRAMPAEEVEGHLAQGAWTL